MPFTVDTAVIPIAGLGTRFLPATKMVPKELLTLVDRPLIQYVVEEASNAGITKIIFIDSPQKQGRVERQFSPNEHLESQLRSAQKYASLEALEHSNFNHMRFITVLQNKPLGLGHAILQAENVLSPGNFFAVLLPDVIMSDGGEGADLRNMIQQSQEHAAYANILLKEVPRQSVHKYGIADLDGHSFEHNIAETIHALVEKPSPDQAPSNWSIAGRYILSTDIFNYLRNLTFSSGNEIQLTDALQSACQDKHIIGCVTRQGSFDCGSHLGYLQATIHIGLRHPILGPQFRALIND